MHIFELIYLSRGFEYHVFTFASRLYAFFSVHVFCGKRNCAQYIKPIHKCVYDSTEATVICKITRCVTQLKLHAIQKQRLHVI